MRLKHDILHGARVVSVQEVHLRQLLGARGGGRPEVDPVDGAVAERCFPEGWNALYVLYFVHPAVPAHISFRCIFFSFEHPEPP